MKTKLLLLVVIFAAIELLIAQDDPKVLPEGQVYQNDTGGPVFLFDAGQMDTLVAKINKAWGYKEKSLLCDSLLIVRGQRIAVLEQLASNDSTQIQLLEDAVEVYQELQPRWYQKWGVGFVSGAAAMYLAVRAAAGL